MRAEYKRDMNHNYLVLYGEDEIDTSTYQVRMLVGNVVPSLLKCRIQGVDGEFSVYYDITSRQSLLTFYENKKFREEDLKLIFGEFIRVMEDAAEYLMNPEQLVLLPEYMFLEVEKKEISFCFLPGYQKDVKTQFQTLTEYILPKIDHGDEMAVMIGYGIYKRALEDSFHLEHMKEELYRKREEDTGKSREIFPEYETEKEEEPEAEELEFSRRNSREVFRASKDSKSEEQAGKKKGSVWKKIAGFGVSVLVLAVILTAKMLGYLPEIEVSTILGAVLVGMGAGMLVFVIGKRVRKKREEEEKQNPERKLRRERAREEREFLKRQESRQDTGTLYEDWGGRNAESDFCRPPENREGTMSRRTAQIFPEKTDAEEAVRSCGETVVLSMNMAAGPPSLVSREPGELASIYLEKELTIIGKLKTASDAVIDLPTVSRVHAKIRKRDGSCYLTDLNSRNGTTVNGRLLKPEEEYCLQNEDEVDFAQARYVFLE